MSATVRDTNQAGDVETAQDTNNINHQQSVVDANPGEIAEL